VLVAGSRIAGYVLEEQVGAGGMAVVFRARDERLGRPVALKVLAPGLAADAGFRRRFLRESRAAAAVDDPHIIPVYEAGEAGGVLFIAMRYVSGGDVRGLLLREGPLALARVAAIISPVASALDAAHAAGLVHRDVKPGNMLIDARPGRPDHVYLSDFGLARAGSASALTETGVGLGTVAYMAPEQIQGGVVDGRADQYALGCAAFELLCGWAPFERDQDVAVLYAHLSAPPPSLAPRRAGVPDRVDGVLARVLAKAPGDRYASCGEFAEALRQALGVPGYDRDPRAVARHAAPVPGQAPGGSGATESGATVVRPVTGGHREVQEPGSPDLGERKLKDLDRPVRLFELDAPGLDSGVPPATGRPGHEAASEVPAAREQVAPGAFAAAVTRALPRDIASFTGRRAELAQLMERLAAAASGGAVRLCAIGGMAGAGKTTLAMHAAHRLAGDFPDGQFFLPLHAHTAGRRPVDPADALASLLLTAGVPAQLIPPGLEARAGRWRDVVAGRKILLLLDDAAGHDQVRPLLPGTAGSLVLVTSRRRLAALEDAAVISLETLRVGEAAELLARLAGRPDLTADTGAAAEITRLCGYLPLAIGMLASQLRHHPAWTAAELAARLAAARDRLALMHAENLSVAAAFDLSYADLTPGQQRLFRRLGLVPGPSFDAHAAAALDGTTLDAARRLDELYDQHLLTEPAPGRYQLHDLVREHARALAAADDPADTGAATGRLLDYYLHAAAIAGQHFSSSMHNARPVRPPPGDRPAFIPGQSTVGQATAWLEAELPNLHAAADYAAASGRSLYAMQVPEAISGFLAVRGLWDQSQALHQSALAVARASADRLGEATALGELGFVANIIGDYPSAVESLAGAAALYGDIGDLPRQAWALTYLSFTQRLTGDCRAAIADYQQALALARQAGDRLAEADALTHLGEVQHLTGDYPAAADSQQLALRLYSKAGNRDGQAWAFNDLGMIWQETGDHERSAASQRQALALFRDLGNRFGEAIALNDLGILQRETGDYPAAEASHRQALEMFRDLGARLNQAEALNRLGELSSHTSATEQAREQHTQALAIARDIGMPFEEARALEGLGRAYLHDGDAGQAAAHLHQALSIFQRTGSPRAGRIQATLRDHSL
jgi:tetratricopeptide (TPR) repeat protein